MPPTDAASAATADTAVGASASSVRAGVGVDGAGVTVGDLLDRLDVAVGALQDVDVDVLGDDGVGQVLAAAERQSRRLRSLRARLAGVLTARRAAAARAADPDDGRAAQRAATQVRGELCDQLGLTPSEAKKVTTTGARLADLPVTAAAHADGRLTDGHVAVIAEVTAHFTGDDRRAFESELVELAGRCRDAVVFGRHARRRLIERDHDAAMEDLRRRKARRKASVTQTDDGTSLLRLETAGYEGELLHTVVDAFRSPDGAGVHRTAEQRTHDAIVAAFETALRAGAASTQHGVRPQVALVLQAESVRDGDGAVDTRWTGPLPYAEVARVLGDCRLTRLVADANGVPVSVTRKVRTVPAGLWELLVARDGGCIWPGCDAPAGWCQVAHLETPFADDGKLSPDTAGLLCAAGPNHHAIYDDQGYRVDWVDGRPHVCRPDGTRLAEAVAPTTSGYSGRSGPVDPTGSAGGDLRLVREARGTYRVGRSGALRPSRVRPPAGPASGGGGPPGRASRASPVCPPAPSTTPP